MEGDGIYRWEGERNILAWPIEGWDVYTYLPPFGRGALRPRGWDGVGWGGVGWDAVGWRRVDE